MDFLGSSDSSDNESPALNKKSTRRKDEDGLRVNKEFAEKFENQRRRQELQSLKDVDLESGDGSGSDSESETEDEDAEMLTPALDVQIMKTINMIRSKDPGIYDTGKEWFAAGDDDDSDGDDDGDDDSADGSKTKKTEKPKRYKDVLREQIMSAETAQDAISSDESDGEAARSEARGRGRGLAYDEEQRELREGLLGSIAQYEAGGEGSDDDDDDGDDLLKVRIKTDAEIAKEEEELRLEAEKMAAAGDGGEDDAFLKDFVANRRWLDPAAKKALPSYDEVVAGSDVDDSEDGDDLDRADAFESKYNFRFEEEGGGEIALHARNVEGSMRRKDDKRKRIRENRKVRKAEERSQKEAELRRLKNLKREEIRKRLKKIQEMSGGALVGAEGIDLAGGGGELGGERLGSRRGSGNGKGAAVPGAEALVDGEFDPDKWDAVTGTAFGDEYYEAEDADSGWKPGDDPLEGLGDLDQYDGGDEGTYGEGVGDEAGEEWEGGDGENGDGGEGFGGVWGSEEEGGERGEGDEEEEGEEDGDGYGGVGAEKERLLDELYKLDYEDIIGDIPCRFKYTRVKSNDFGLSPEEILLADDKELNKYVPLKKLAPYRHEDPRLDARRRWQLRNEVRAREAAAEEEMLALKKSKRRGRRKKKAAGEGAPAEDESAEPGEEGAAVDASESVEAAAGAASEVADQLAGGKRRRRKKGQKKKRDQAAGMDGAVDGESEAALVPRVVPVAAPDRGDRQEVETATTDAAGAKGKKRARKSNGASAGQEELNGESGEMINGKAGSDDAEVAGVDADGEGDARSKKKRARRGSGGKGGRARGHGKDDDEGKHGGKARDRKTKKMALATGVSTSRLASYGL